MSVDFKSASGALNLDQLKSIQPPKFEPLESAPIADTLKAAIKLPEQSFIQRSASSLKACID
jgi:hypothetical protein